MDDGRLRYELKRPWKDGTSAVALTPAAFVERLMALIPRPLVNIVNYNEVFAPRHRWRPHVVQDRASGRAEIEARRLDEQRTAIWEQLLKEPPPTPAIFVELSSSNWSWARLMKRAFGYEVLTCDRCGGQRKVISTLTQAAVVEKILECLGIEIVDCEPQPARAPPEPEAYAEQVAWGW